MRKTSQLGFWILSIYALFSQCKRSEESTSQNTSNSKNSLVCEYDKKDEENKGVTTTQPFIIEGSYNYSHKWNDADDVKKAQKDAPSFSLLISYKNANDAKSKTNKVPYELKIDLSSKQPDIIDNGKGLRFEGESGKGTKWTAYVKNDKKIRGLLGVSGKEAAGLYIDKIFIQNDELFGKNQYKNSNTVLVSCKEPADAMLSYDGKICPDQSIKAPYPTLSINFTRNAMTTSGRYRFQINHSDNTPASTSTGQNFEDTGTLAPGNSRHTTSDFIIKKAGLYSIKVFRLDDKMNDVSRVDEQVFAETQLCPGPLTLTGPNLKEVDSKSIPNKSAFKQHQISINEADKDSVVVGAGAAAKTKKEQLCQTITNLNLLKRACESRNNTSCGSAPLTFVDDTNTQINLNFKCVFKYSDQTKNNIPGCRIENDVWQSYIYNKYQESDIDAANCGKPEID